MNLSARIGHIWVPREWNAAAESLATRAMERERRRYLSDRQMAHGQVDTGERGALE